MRWSWSRFFIILTVLILVLGIAFMVFLIHARRRGFDYQFQVDAVLAAAAVANENTLTEDPARSVVSSWQGKKWIVSPNNYSALSAYLRRDAAMPLFMRIDPEKALTITCCGDSVFRVQPEDESGESVLIELKSGGETFRMHARGGLLWKGLLEAATKGTYHDENLSLN